MAYRVELPVFSGPLDLLLHLIKQQEVDIHEVAIASILDQYLEHLAVLRDLDLADIGDFVVMASTLMEIKSRELLPSEAIAIEEELDAKDDLIRRLLEYKRYRDVSRRFERMSRRRQRMLDASLPMPEALGALEDDDGALDLDNVEIWALTAAFSKLLEETGSDVMLHVGVERRDVRYYIERILDRVRGGGEVSFEELFDRSEGRLGLVGTLIAILEMMKQGFLRARQERCFGPITVNYVGPSDLVADQVATHERFSEAAAAGDVAESSVQQN